MPYRVPEKLQLLLEVGRLLSSKLELSELLTTIMQLGARIVDAETASLLLLDEARKELYFDVALGLGQEKSAVRLKLGEGIAGTAAAEGRPLLINDAAEDPRWSSTMDERTGFKTRSILAAPILLKGRAIGVIEAINRKDGSFTLMDLRVFEAFASQAAVAIENARLFARLREEKIKLSTLIDEMGDAAALTDAQGSILVANRPARGLFADASATTTVAALDGYAVKPALAEIAASTEPAVAFEAVREEPKRLILAGTATRVENADGRLEGRVVVFRDVTEARQEEGLKRTFLSLISHKLKTPLASVNGYSQLLLDDLSEAPDTDFRKKSLKTIYSQGQKLQGLVEKLLNYTFLDGLEGEEAVTAPFPLSKACADAVEALKPWLNEKNGSVELGVSEDLIAQGDPGLIRDAIKGLIENAVKFGGGKAKLLGSKDGGHVELRVVDEGPGIPPEEIEKIFGRFYQIDASFTGQVDGWGLGLPFARKVAQRFGGSVEACSQLGKGTTVTLRLPKSS